MVTLDENDYEISSATILKLKIITSSEISGPGLSRVDQPRLIVGAQGTFINYQRKGLSAITALILS